MEKYSVTIIVPVYKPDKKFEYLLRRLKTQTYPIEKLLIMNTEIKFWKKEWELGFLQMEVHHLSRAEFDHGGTRAAAAALCTSDLLLYFTQDAVPADDKVVENLVKAFDNPMVGAAYGRQLADKDCRIQERYTRTFNYPDKSLIKGKADIPRLGIKTYFCSNVCAVYRRELYNKLGGFVTHTIFNEDMIYAGKLVQAGHLIAYQADARVIHSHNYGNIQQFKRNFDMAVSQAEHPEIFSGIKSESEGIRLIKKTAAHLIFVHKPWLLPDLVVKSGCKYMGYCLGRNYKRLPMWLIRRCTMNASYWTLTQ